MIVPFTLVINRLEGVTKFESVPLMIMNNVYILSGSVVQCLYDYDYMILMGFIVNKRVIYSKSMHCYWDLRIEQIIQRSY